MKKKIFKMLTIIFPGLLLTGSGYAQGYDIQQLLLDVQKLATLKSMLADMKQAYQTLDKDYTAVRDVAQGSFNLHKAFLDGLLAVSPAVRSYQRASEIVNLQTSLLTKYRAGWGYFQHLGVFHPEEMVLISQVYGGLLQDSLKDLDDLSDVLTDGTIRASDAERMRQIDVIYERLSARVAFIDEFNNSTVLLAGQREGVYAEGQTVQHLYGINP